MREGVVVVVVVVKYENIAVVIGKSVGILFWRFRLDLGAKINK